MPIGKSMSIFYINIVHIGLSFIIESMFTTSKLTLNNIRNKYELVINKA